MNLRQGIPKLVPAAAENSPWTIAPEHQTGTIAGPAARIANPLPSTSATRLPTMTKPHQVVARYLRDRIAMSGLTQRQVADAIFMDQPAMSRRLTGQTPFTIDDLALIVQYLGLDYSQMMAEILQMLDDRSTNRLR